MGKKTDVLDPLGLASSVAFAYVILFVALVIIPTIRHLSNRIKLRGLVSALA